jgi:hypothetical protein
MKRDISWGVLLAIVATGAVLAVAQEETAGASRVTKLPLSAETDHYEVVLTGIVSDQDREDFCVLHLSVKGRAGQGQAATPVGTPLLEDPYGTPEQVRVELLVLPDDRMLIETNNTVRPDNMTECHLVQVADWSVLDCWLCRKATLSPSLRYVAMDRGSQTHGPERLGNSKILCYDLESTWIERGIVPIEKRQPYDDAVAYNAGVVLFPPQHAQLQAYTLPEDFTQSGEGKYDLGSPLLWSPDSSFVVFLSIYDHQTFIIRCNLPNAEGKVRWGQRLIQIEESMVPPAKISAYRYYKEHDTQILALLQAKEIKWVSANEVLLQSAWEGSLLDHMQVTIPEVQD